MSEPWEEGEDTVADRGTLTTVFKCSAINQITGSFDCLLDGNNLEHETSKCNLCAESAVGAFIDRFITARNNLH